MHILFLLSYLDLVVLKILNAGFSLVRLMTISHNSNILAKTHIIDLFGGSCDSLVKLCECHKQFLAYVETLNAFTQSFIKSPKR